jgi:hypothetical protein
MVISGTPVLKEGGSIKCEGTQNQKQPPPPALPGWTPLVDGGDDAEHVVHVDAIADVEAAGNGLFAKPCDAHLPVGIVRIGEVDVEGELPMNADRLDPLDDRRFGAFEHARTTASPPPAASPA